MAAYAEAIWATWVKGDAAIPAAPESRVLLSERFDDASTLPLWHGVTSDQVETGALGSRLRLTNKSPNGSVYATRWLDVATFAGQRVKISARISGESVGVPPKPYNGIKLMLVVKNPAGKTDQPQAAAAFSGNFEPRLIQFTHAIPADSQEIQLKLGLELAAGSVFYEDIRIEAAP